MGKDKCCLVLGNEDLLCRVIDRLSQLNGQIIVALAQKQSIPHHNTSHKIDYAWDVHYGKGPLGGIYSGLKISQDKYCLAVACDMPFLNIDLIRYMTGLIDGYDVVIPRLNGLLEPLHAVYSVNCVKAIDKMLKEDIRGIRYLLKVVNVRYVVEKEVDFYDPEHLSFFNVNMPSDMEKAMQLMEREEAINDFR